METMHKRKTFEIEKQRGTINKELKLETFQVPYNTCYF